MRNNSLRSVLLNLYSFIQVSGSEVFWGGVLGWLSEIVIGGMGNWVIENGVSKSKDVRWTMLK